jgi:hypothetical protein
MSATAAVARGRGDTATVTLPERPEFNPALGSPKFLRITLECDQTRTGIFEVAKNARAGADGDEIWMQPGQLKLGLDEAQKAWAEPVSVWAWRRSQLATTNGALVLATFIAATSTAWIDGSLAIGKVIGPRWLFAPETLAAMSAVSMVGKFVTAGCAFLLALWFKK